jgi:hypothetical protein
MTKVADHREQSNGPARQHNSNAEAFIQYLQVVDVENSTKV